MNITILAKSKDHRTNTNIIYALIDINDYLKLVGEDFDRFDIQRKRQEHKAYDRLRNDIIQGASIPPITLAIDPSYAQGIVKEIEENAGNLLLHLNDPDRLNILDGLQRTYIISDIIKSGKNFHPEQKILLEFWVEPEMKHLIYRLIVLNAGQKPMSLKHQLELLFMTFIPTIREKVADIIIVTEKEKSGARSKGEFYFDRVVTSYNCFLTRTPEVDKQNLIAKELVEESVLDKTEEELAEIFDSYLKYLKQYVKLDKINYEKSKLFGSSNYNWFADENVMHAFFSAVSDFAITPQREARIHESISSLVQQLSINEEDNIGIDRAKKIINSYNARKMNVGVATRKLYFNTFKEFFRESGEKPLKDCWAQEA